MLKSRVWSSDTTADHVTKKFIPVHIDGREQPAVAKAFEVKAYPTIVLAEADGTVITTKRGAAGLDTPERFNTWADLQLEGATALPGLLKEAEDTDDPDKLLALADKLIVLGRKEEAADILARAEDLLAERLLQTRLERAKLMLSGMKDSPELRKLMDPLIKEMIDSEDDRIVAPAFQYANTVARLADKKDPQAARQLMLDLREAFPEHASVRGMRTFAAMYAHLGGDDETAIAEMKEFIKEDEENEVDDAYTKRARLFVERVEKGERYR
jgi:tetratricopeptide (TPR) repeat protein